MGSYRIQLNVHIEQRQRSKKKFAFVIIQHVIMYQSIFLREYSTQMVHVIYEITYLLNLTTKPLYLLLGTDVETALFDLVKGPLINWSIN